MATENDILMQELDEKDDGFVLARNTVFDLWLRILGTGPTMLYLLLKRFCHGEECTVFAVTPRQKDWAARLGVSKPAVTSYFQTLEKHGLITITTPKNVSRFDRIPSRYTLNKNPKVTEDDRQGVDVFPEDIRFGDYLFGETTLFRKKANNSPGKDSLLTLVKNSSSPRAKIFTHPGKDSLPLVQYREEDTTKDHTSHYPATVGPDNENWEALAALLSKIVRLKHKLVISPQKIKAWAKEIKKLSTVEKVPPDRIWAAMRWYAENYDANGRFSLVIECGQTFRDKFPRLEEAMKRDVSFSKNDPVTTGSLQVPDCPETEQLYDWLASVLGGSANVQLSGVAQHIREMHQFLKSVPKNPQQDPSESFGEHATAHFSWDVFFSRYMEFLVAKQRPGYMLQHLNGIKIGGQRWNEFIQGCERRSCFSWKTGEYIG